MANYADPTVISLGQSSRIKPGPILVLVSGVLALLVAVTLLLAKVNTDNQTEAKLQAADTTKAEIAKMSNVNARIQEYKSTVANLNILFDNQRQWEAIIKKIEASLYKKTRIINLQAGESGVLVISGTTTDYTEYAKLYRSLTDPSLKDVFSIVRPTAVTRVEDAAGNLTEVGYTFNIQLTAKALAPVAGEAGN